MSKLIFFIVIVILIVRAIKFTKKKDTSLNNLDIFRKIKNELAQVAAEVEQQKKAALQANTLFNEDEQMTVGENDQVLVDDYSKQIPPIPLPSIQQMEKVQPEEQNKYPQHCHCWNLKKAVIWSEILAPPVCLRDRNDMFYELKY